MKKVEESPECYDQVKHKHNEMVGTVIAKYSIHSVVYLDVRGFDERIYYKTPIDNWEVIYREADLYE